MSPNDLFAEVIRRLDSGLVIWKLENRADAESLRFVLANPAASRLSRVDFTRCANKTMAEVVPAAIVQGRHELYAKVVRSGVETAFDLVLDERVSERQILAARAVPLPDDCLAIMFDSGSVQKRVEEDARRLTVFLDSIVEHIPAMVFVKDAEELRFELFNRAGELLLGKRREELLGKNDYELGFPKAQADFFQAKDREVLQSKKLLDIPEEPLETSEGRRWLHTKKIPILDGAGMPRHLLGISLDITDRKLASETLRTAHEDLERRVAERTADLVEANLALKHQVEERQRTEEALEKAEEQLRQAQKMEAVGRLAGGIAHDFNNLLSVIIGYTSMLIVDSGEHSPIKQDLDEIRKAGERAAELTRQLLAFSRQQVLAPTVVNLNDVIGRMDKMLRRVIGEDIELLTLEASDLGTIKADQGQIEQVIMNLAVNSRDAMPNGGRLVIETGNVDFDEDSARDHLGLSPGPHVMLSVSDTGIGIDKAIQGRIFEPFFTTKEQGKGTGLGLSTVFGIIKQSGGGIFVSSEPGRGATFRVYFARTDERPASIPPPTSVDQSFRGAETILLVEDEEQVRALVRGILKRHGYRVFEAPHPAEALHLGATLDEEIQLLITDVVMPQMNGRQLAERLRAARPEMEVLYMSGYTDHAIDRDGVLEPGIAFLQKPIMPVTLMRMVRELLDSKARASQRPQ
ncbi:MAG TPA: PAS domain-containing protein [Polyangiaceae bacterium]|nr:PAS domain-containing protein [Polyangiaceae bacterium]